jgi:5-formyltetrahydrofolate cyclo-ligase
MSPNEDTSKGDLRERSRRARDGIDPVDRLERSEAIHERLYDLERFREASSIAIYFSTGSEVLTGPLAIRLAEHERKRLLLPFVLNHELQLTEWRPSDPVVDAEYGGMHPRYRLAAPVEDVDVIILPGLAFDSECHRLGEGRGLVDALLRRLDPGTVRIGLAFDEQIVPSVPTDAGDERMHVVATESELIVSAEALATELAR